VNAEVVDNRERARYEIRADGENVGSTAYEIDDHGRVVFLHTEIDSAYEGEGLGGKLARGALDDARRQGKQVVTVCPFIAAYVRKHPEYADLLVPGS
jgi:uncharacterized protein